MERQRGKRAGGDAPGQQQIPLGRGAIVKMNDQIQAYELAAQAAREKFGHLDVSADELEGLVAEVVRAMLFKMHEKQQAPIKRQDLNTLITGNRKGAVAKQLPGLVIPLAQAKLASCMGIEMKELKRVAGSDAAAVGSRKRAAAAAAAAASQGPLAAGDSGAGPQGAPPVTITYVLHSLLPWELYKELVSEPSEEPAQGLLMTVLALLQLNGGGMDEEELWRHLGQLGVLRGRDHPVFGRPEEQLQQMYTRRYITQLKDGDGKRVEWAETAEQLLGHDSVRGWVDQLLEDGKAADAAAALRRRSADLDQENVLTVE